MADTTVLKSEVEDYVRAWLQQKFGKPFRKDKLALVGVQGVPKTHEFDGVSEDRAVVCGIKTSSWKTSGGKWGAGKIAVAYMEIYFLSHVAAKQKYLVLTDSEFHAGLEKQVEGKLAVGVGLLRCDLPRGLAEKVGAVRRKSRKEQGAKAQ